MTTATRAACETILRLLDHAQPLYKVAAWLVEQEPMQMRLFGEGDEG